MLQFANVKSLASVVAKISVFLNYGGPALAHTSADSFGPNSCFWHKLLYPNPSCVPKLKWLLDSPVSEISRKFQILLWHSGYFFLFTRVGSGRVESRVKSYDPFPAVTRRRANTGRKARLSRRHKKVRHFLRTFVASY